MIVLFAHRNFDLSVFPETLTKLSAYLKYIKTSFCISNMVLKNVSIKFILKSMHVYVHRRFIIYINNGFSIWFTPIVILYTRYVDICYYGRIDFRYILVSLFVCKYIIKQSKQLMPSLFDCHHSSWWSDFIRFSVNKIFKLLEWHNCPAVIALFGIFSLILHSLGWWKLLCSLVIYCE